MYLSASPASAADTASFIESGQSGLTCVVTTVGELRCIGSYNRGGIDLSPEQQEAFRTAPGYVHALEPLRAVSLGVVGGCVHSVLGKVACWSLGGILNGSQSDLPFQDLAEVTSVEAGDMGHRCAIDDRSEVTCVGSSASWSQIPSEITSATSIQLDGNIIEGERACAIGLDNLLRCWGRIPVVGSLMTQNTDASLMPSGIGAVKQIAISKVLFCAVRLNDSAVCWHPGYSAGGAPGTTAQYPVLPASWSHVKSVAVSDSGEYCAILADSTVSCGGLATPSGLGPVSQLTLSHEGFACAIRTSGQVSCWGPGAPNPAAFFHPQPVAPSITVAPDTSSFQIAPQVRFAIAAGKVAYCSVDGSTPAVCSSPFTMINLSSGEHTFQVKARDEYGLDSQPAVVTWSQDLPEGASVNEAAIYTNDPKVTLSLVWPAGATAVLVANDGGFRTAKRLSLASFIPWTIQTSGLERLPKTVYVRFVGAGATTYTDDIILDQTAPTLSSASGTTGTILARRGSASALTSKPAIKLKLSASDKTSGVGTVQVTSDKTKAGVTAKFATSVTVLKPSTTAKTFYVRVQDKAKNYSAWKTVTVK